MRLRHFRAHGVPFIPVDTTLAMLKIDGVARKVPVNEGVAVLVEVQAFLTN
jgi:hypothetical protein